MRRALSKNKHINHFHDERISGIFFFLFISNTQTNNVCELIKLKAIIQFQMWLNGEGMWILIFGFSSVNKVIRKLKSISIFNRDMSSRRSTSFVTKLSVWYKFEFNFIAIRKSFILYFCWDNRNGNICTLLAEECTQCFSLSFY